MSLCQPPTGDLLIRDMHGLCVCVCVCGVSSCVVFFFLSFSSFLFLTLNVDILILVIECIAYEQSLRVDRRDNF